ncbi:alpha-L-fucosidase [Pseudonocardia adelaidensis]|uniref:alpha-L-fucosidase n=1 Tax=Pseudonocardia adelaidensis TaxID=648754 RepID=UPI0031EB77BD
MTVDWSRLSRPLPDWYADAKFGIFVHWGAYSVPAWAEPTGELGTVDEGVWFRHNSYAEWYWNTIRFDDSPAREHHRRVHGDAPYDDFLDAWKAEEFDPKAWCDLFARAGARYVVPTSKHHDGIALWDAPGTATRNTVHRGPHRDLIGDLASAARAAGMRFGVYYSGGLDWSVTEHLPAIDTFANVRAQRPIDAAYAAYAYLHVRDLVDRYRPDVLWNDIEWPDAGKHAGQLGLFELFRHFYATVPDGVVNDRWGDTHWDYRTSEYQHGLEAETAPAWENNRGIGLSFGYNRVEDSRHLISGPQLVRHLVDVVSRGGNMLLNVGPTASGLIPEGQRRTLEELAGWMAANPGVVHGSRPLEDGIADDSDEPWVRWTRTGDRAWAVVDASGRPGRWKQAGRVRVVLPARADRLELASAALADGAPVAAQAEPAGVAVELPSRDLPVAVGFDVR